MTGSGQLPRGQERFDRFARPVVQDQRDALQSPGVDLQDRRRSGRDCRHGIQCQRVSRLSVLQQGHELGPALVVFRIALCVLLAVRNEGTPAGFGRAAIALLVVGLRSGTTPAARPAELPSVRTVNAMSG